MTRQIVRLIVRRNNPPPAVRQCGYRPAPAPGPRGDCRPERPPRDGEFKRPPRRGPKRFRRNAGEKPGQKQSGCAETKKGETTGTAETKK